MINAKRITVLISTLSLFVLLIAPANCDVSEVRILMYHGIDASYGEPPAQFYAEMDLLHDNGYNTITMAQFYDWRVNNIPLPDKSIVLTFDDNYITVYDTAYPYLQSLGFVATNFTHTNYVGVVTSYDHCDWTEINEMETAGVFYTESHTKSHLNLPTLSDVDENEELQGSKTAIEANMPGKTCNHLAYPYGAYDADTITKTQAAGYLTAVTTIAGVNTKTTPLFELKRYAINPGDSLDTFKTKIGFIPGSTETLLVDNAYYSNFSTGAGWTESTSEPGYYNTNYSYHAAGTGTSSATFTFYVENPGLYRVDAWWTEHSNRATNAPYTINHADGSTTYYINQTVAGGQWNSFGLFTFDAGNPTVTISDDADGYVIADAVRLVYISTAVESWTMY